MSRKKKNERYWKRLSTLQTARVRERLCPLLGQAQAYQTALRRLSLFSSNLDTPIRRVPGRPPGQPHLFLAVGFSLEIATANTDELSGRRYPMCITCASNVLYMPVCKMYMKATTQKLSQHVFFQRSVGNSKITKKRHCTAAEGCFAALVWLASRGVAASSARSQNKSEASREENEEPDLGETEHPVRDRCIKNILTIDSGSLQHLDIPVLYHISQKFHIYHIELSYTTSSTYVAHASDTPNVPNIPHIRHIPHIALLPHVSFSSRFETDKSISIKLHT